MNQYSGNFSGAYATGTDRVTFIRRTYIHLAFAILGFALIDALLLETSLGESMTRFITAGRFNWLMFLGGFVVVGWIARSLAHSVESPAMQYLALAGYVVAEAVVFLPLLFMASRIAPDAIVMAGAMTGLLFLGLTATVFLTRSDFSFMRSFLVIGGFVALGAIVCGAIFGFNLGLAFSAGMIVLAAGSILYDTSNVLHHFPADRHVAAALELFASVALLFWYVLRVLMSMRRN